MSTYTTNMQEYLISKGFENTSYGNDVCDSFSKVIEDGYILRIWIDYADVKSREFEESKRFTFCTYDEEMDFISEDFATELWAKACEWLESAI